MDLLCNCVIFGYPSGVSPAPPSLSPGSISVLLCTPVSPRTLPRWDEGSPYSKELAKACLERHSTYKGQTSQEQQERAGCSNPDGTPGARQRCSCKEEKVERSPRPDWDGRFSTVHPTCQTNLLPSISHKGTAHPSKALLGSTPGQASHQSLLHLQVLRGACAPAWEPSLPVLGISFHPIPMGLSSDVLIKIKTGERSLFFPEALAHPFQHSCVLPLPSDVWRPLRGTPVLRGKKGQCVCISSTTSWLRLESEQ